MRTEERTSNHLLLALITTGFSGMLVLVTLVMAWEIWMVPLMAAGCLGVWLLHIARAGSHLFYENLCAALMLALFMLNKKWILYAIESLYGLELLYHLLILGTLSADMDLREIFRLVLGAGVTLGGAVLADYWIGRRTAQQAWYTSVFAELETAGKQNAVFLSNVSHELRTPINMVLGISEVALGKELAPDVRSDLTSIKLAGKRLSNQINNMLD